MRWTLILIRNSRREMDGIGTAALSFLKKHAVLGFAKDYAAIGVALTARIKKEGSILYPLYMPSY